MNFRDVNSGAPSGVQKTSSKLEPDFRDVTVTIAIRGTGLSFRPETIFRDVTNADPRGSMNFRDVTGIAIPSPPLIAHGIADLRLRHDAGT